LEEDDDEDAVVVIPLLGDGKGCEGGPDAFAGGAGLACDFVGAAVCDAAIALLEDDVAAGSLFEAAAGTPFASVALFVAPAFFPAGGCGCDRDTVLESTVPTGG